MRAALMALILLAALVQTVSADCGANSTCNGHGHCRQGVECSCIAPFTGDALCTKSWHDPPLGPMLLSFQIVFGATYVVLAAHSLYLFICHGRKRTLDGKLLTLAFICAACLLRVGLYVDPFEMWGIWNEQANYVWHILGTDSFLSTGDRKSTRLNSSHT